MSHTETTQTVIAMQGYQILLFTTVDRTFVLRSFRHDEIFTTTAYVSFYLSVVVCTFHDVFLTYRTLWEPAVFVHNFAAAVVGWYPANKLGKLLSDLSDSGRSVVS